MEQQIVATSPHRSITFEPPATGAEVREVEDALRAAALPPSSPEPSPDALAEVAADLEALDQAPADAGDQDFMPVAVGVESRQRGKVPAAITSWPIPSPGSTAMR